MDKQCVCPYHFVVYAANNRTKDEDLTPDSFDTELFQAVLWTTGFEVSSRDLGKLASGAWASTFDGDPTILPSGQKIPVEIPKLSLASSDESWRVQIGASRAEVTWKRVGDSHTLSSAEFASVSIKTFQDYLETSAEIKVSRVAFVTRRFAPVDNAAKEIANYFVRDAILAGPLSRPNELQLNAHKVYTPSGMPEINSWIKWRNGFIKSTGQPVVTVEHDLNTLAEAPGEFTLSDIAEFFNAAPSESDSILTYYLSFPRHNPS